MDRQPIIAFQDVSFRYENSMDTRSSVLAEVNLSIQKGQFVSIIGHNGSGKSTLAKLMNALLLPTEGVVLVNQINSKNGEMIWEIRQNVGMVFQNPDNQIVGTTVEDDVAFGLENMGVDPQEMRQRIDQSLKAVHMEDFLTRQPHKLSGGQKQRIAIAGIIAMRPEVIILDEATAMLDPQGKQEVMQLARRLNRDEGITMINITHFPEEALESDHVIVMRDGQVFTEGKPEDVFTRIELLQDVGLDVPLAVRIRHHLISHGVELPPVLHQEELVEELCKLLLTK